MKQIVKFWGTFPGGRSLAWEDLLRFPKDMLRVIAKHRRLAAAVFLIVLVVTVGLIVFTPPRYRASSTLLLTPGPGMLAASAMKSHLALASGLSSPETQLEVIAARPNLEQVIEKLELDLTPEELRKRIWLRSPKLTEVVKVTAEGETAQQAADIVNLLLEAYISGLERRHEEDSGTAAGDVKRRLLEVEQQLEAKDREIANWLKSHGMALPNEEMRASVERLSKALSAEQASSLERARLESEGRVLREQLLALHPQLRGREVFRTSEVVDKLRIRLNELHTQRAAALYEFKPDQPEVRIIEEQIAATESALRSALRDAVDGELFRSEHEDQANPVRLKALELLVSNEAATASLNAKLTVLAKHVQRLKEQTSQIPDLAEKLTAMTREQEVLGRAWASLATHYEDLKVQQYAGALRPQIVEPATPPDRKSRPRPVLWSVVGLMMACVLSVAACFAMESVDKRVTSQRDATELLRLPALGTFSLPLSDQEAEALWSLVRLRTSNKPLRHVVVACFGTTGISDALSRAAKRVGRHSADIGNVGVVISEIHPSTSASWNALTSADCVLLAIKAGVKSEEVEDSFLGVLRDATSMVGVAVFTGSRCAHSHPGVSTEEKAA